MKRGRDYAGGMVPIARAEPDVHPVLTGRSVLVAVEDDGLSFRAAGPEDPDSDLLTVREWAVS